MYVSAEIFRRFWPTDCCWSRALGGGGGAAFFGFANSWGLDDGGGDDGGSDGGAGGTLGGNCGALLLGGGGALGGSCRVPYSEFPA